MLVRQTHVVSTRGSTSGRPLTATCRTNAAHVLSTALVGHNGQYNRVNLLMLRCMVQGKIDTSKNLSEDAIVIMSGDKLWDDCPA